MINRFFILFFLGLLPWGSALSGDIDSTVKYVRADKSGQGYIAFNADKTSNPSCSNSHPSHLAFDLNTEGGKAIMSLGLTAKAAGLRIVGHGTNGCTVYGSVEDWNWGYIKD